MYNIVLLCQYGASTTIVAEKIEQAAKERGIEVVVNAYSASEIDNVIDTASIILLGPQVRFRLKRFQTEYADRNVPIVAMEASDYGRLNGERILDTVLSALENK